MQVHLIKTPDYPAENFKEVIDVLRGSDGPVTFVSSEVEFKHEDFFILTRKMRSQRLSDLNLLEKSCTSRSWVCH